VGKFIVFEGITGSGKTEMVTRTAEYLESLGEQTVITFEPGLGLLEASPEQMDRRNLIPVTKAMLLIADRLEHVNNEIDPALHEGLSVVCERYVDCTEAYQGYGEGLTDFLFHMDKINFGFREPNIKFLLDVDPAIGFHRKPRRVHSFDEMDPSDQSGLGFQSRVRKGYLQIFNTKKYNSNNHSFIISTTRLRIDEVWSEVKKNLDYALVLQNITKGLA